MLTALRLQRTCLWTYLASLALQFYAAGLAVFGVSGFMSHALPGYGIALEIARGTRRDGIAAVRSAVA